MDERIIKSTTPPSASPCSSLVSDASMVQEEEEDSVSEASASSCSFSGKILRVGGRVIEEKLFIFNPVLSFRSEKTLGDSQRGGSTARRDRSRQIWGCVQRALQGAGGRSEGISSFSSVQSFLCLSYALKVSNPVRSRADYEAAQEGIIREVGTFCRCKHPSLVR